MSINTNKTAQPLNTIRFAFSVRLPFQFNSLREITRKYCSVKCSQMCYRAFLYLNVPRLYTLDVVRVVIIERRVWSTCGVILEGVNMYWNRFLPFFSANLTTTYLAWNCPYSNPGRHDENLATNCVSHVTSLKTILT
jgi:hypothetical protein